MQGYNLIAVVNEDLSEWLMCRRRKEPYKGLYNLVGGHIEPGEDSADAAYRELFEETGITKDDIVLTHLMDYTYYLEDCYVEVYAGRLRKSVKVHGEENELVWMNFDENFFNTAKFAEDGSIGHILENIRNFSEKILK